MPAPASPGRRLCVCPAQVWLSMPLTPRLLSDHEAAPPSPPRGLVSCRLRRSSQGTQLPPEPPAAGAGDGECHSCSGVHSGAGGCAHLGRALAELVPQNNWAEGPSRVCVHREMLLLRAVGRMSPENNQVLREQSPRCPQGWRAQCCLPPRAERWHRGQLGKGVPAFGPAQDSPNH